jgi:aldose 1-epimerase
MNGIGSGEITGHILFINADGFLPVDDTQIPNGNIENVTGTPFDFRNPQPIGARIDDEDEQLKHGNGYDLNYVLNADGAKALNLAATVVGDKSGIRLDVLTQEPGLQFYSGNFMFGDNILKGGVTDDFRTAFALETQHFPDSPNKPQFPSTILKPGSIYKTTTIYKLSVER